MFLIFTKLVRYYAKYARIMCEMVRIISGVANTELFVRKSRKTLEKVCLEALLNKGLLLKERICSQREQILSFKSSPKCREPNILYYCHFIIKKFLTHVTHMRTCVLSATPMIIVLYHMFQTKRYFNGNDARGKKMALM